jgi:hypothetical protein
MRLFSALLAVCAIVLSAPGSAVAHTSHGYRIVWDDFQHGFSDTRWTISSFGSLVLDDGIISTSPHGLRVTAKGTNATTGAPAFTLTVPPDPDLGGLDHVKWIAFSTHVASSGQVGFDAVPGQELSCETWLSARTYGTEAQPFGSLVRDPGDDLRLASVAMNAADNDTGMVFDFFLTNHRVYAFYERGIYNRPQLGNYAAFSFAIPVAWSFPGEPHHLRIGYDAAGGTVRWYVDGREVYRVNRIGHLIDRRFMLLDYGGTETDVRPRQLNCGMGMFSVLDGGTPGVPASGLVRLANAGSLYFDPVSGEPTPQTFADDASRPESRLFGQGASFAMPRYEVSSQPIGRDR